MPAGHYPHKSKPVLERLLAKVSVDPITGCWLWTGTVDAGGYARIKVGGRNGTMASAHRVSYELHVKPIPEGLDIDHLCRVRHCVNPDHMEPVTHRDNVVRGLAPTVSVAAAAAIKLARTHCKQGHEYTEDNTYVYTRSNGKTHRQCRMCQHVRVTKPSYRAKRRKPH